MSTAERRDSDFARRALLVIAAVAGFGVALWFAWAAFRALLLIFSSIILAIGLDGLARCLYAVVPLSRRLSVACTALLVAAILGAVLTFGVVNIEAQAPRLRHEISQSIDRISAKLQHLGVSVPWRETKQSAADDGHNSLGTRLATELSSAATLTFNTLADAFVVAVIGFYLAFQPRIYRRAIIRLWPRQKRRRVAALIAEIGLVIRRWLMGRGLSMLAVGVGSTLGLGLLGLPFALLLGLIAGILTFIPYLGAIISAVPALLVAALHGLDRVFYVLALYLLLHIVEGYVLSPMIQKRAVSLAPGFLLITQVLGYSVAGAFGMMLAAPIALTGEVIVQIFYVQGVIGEEPHLPA